jgi:hypothetical protein
LTGGFLAAAAGFAVAGFAVAGLSAAGLAAAGAVAAGGEPPDAGFFDGSAPCAWGAAHANAAATSRAR